MTFTERLLRPYGTPGATRLILAPEATVVAPGCGLLNDSHARVIPGLKPRLVGTGAVAG